MGEIGEDGCVEGVMDGAAVIAIFVILIVLLESHASRQQAARVQRAREEREERERAEARAEVQQREAQEECGRLVQRLTHLEAGRRPTVSDVRHAAQLGNFTLLVYEGYLWWEAPQPILPMLELLLSEHRAALIADVPARDIGVKVRAQKHRPMYVDLASGASQPIAPKYYAEPVLMDVAEIVAAAQREHLRLPRNLDEWKPTKRASESLRRLVARRRVEIADLLRARAEREPLAPSLRFQVLQRDEFRCRYCGAGAELANLEVDHVIAVRRGGSTILENLVTACKSCNRGKGARELQGDPVKK